MAGPLPDMSAPIPAGRARWRLTVHTRSYAVPVLGPRDTVLGEILEGRSVRLSQAWNKSAQLTFSADGDCPCAEMLDELAVDVRAWRWDETLGRDVCMFRGVVGQSEDLLSEDVHTINLTCHDYLAILGRRLIT